MEDNQDLLAHYAEDEGSEAFDDLSGLPDLAPAGAGQDGHMYGRRVDVNGGLAAPSPGPFTGDHGKERLWVVMFQQTGETLYRQVTMVLNAGIGGVSFRRTIPMPPGQGNQTPVGQSKPQSAIYAFHVWARHVDIHLQCAQHAICNVAICPADAAAGPQFYSWLYQNLANDLSKGQLITGNGVLGNFRAMYQVLAGAAGTPFYPMVFDWNFAVSGVPPLGTAPLMTLAAVRQLGDDVSFEDEWPGTLQYINGLYVALSSTPDSFTDAGAGEIVWWAKVGG